MSWWNLGGMNPQYKDFVEKHPNKTMIGMAWALYWRFGVFFFILEIIFVALIAIFAILAGQ